jgi:hypothetical protein
LPGRVYASDKSKQAADGLQVVLSEAELAQWNEWLAQYGDVQITQSDNASADSMTTTLHFSGHGSEQPDEAAKQAMLLFAQDLFNKLMK